MGRETAKRRKAKSKMSGGGGGGRDSAFSSRTGRRNSEVELADRLEPDILDFWDPEWEIGRPDWSLPFDAANVVVGGVDSESLALRQSGDLSDVLKRIEERFKRENEATNVNHMFYRN